MRSHPPTLFRLVERTLQEECGVAPGEKLVLAVSGGPDSMALLHVLSQVTDLTLAAVGIDHGLRAEASAELDAAEAFSTGCGVEFVRRRVTVAPGGNLQARARDARYGALEAVRTSIGARWLATAHHADDRAETLLIRLLHGASPDALAVLPPVDGTRVRPMIRASRADVLRHVERHQVPYATDPSNVDPRFLRSRVRGEVLPLLRELSPSFTQHLNHLADDLTALDLSEVSSVSPKAERGAALSQPEAHAPDCAESELFIPEILDENGLPVRLSRAHRQQLRRALRYRQRRTRVLLPGNRTIVLDPDTGRPRLETAKSATSRQKRSIERKS